MLKSDIGTKTFVLPLEVVRAHAEWSERNFGTPKEHGPVGPLRHLAKEAIEAAEAPDRKSRCEELADCTFLLLDALRRADVSAQELAEAMNDKMAILEKRVYRKTGKDMPIEHDRDIPDERD